MASIHAAPAPAAWVDGDCGNEIVKPCGYFLGRQITSPKAYETPVASGTTRMKMRPSPIDEVEEPFRSMNQYAAATKPNVTGTENSNAILEGTLHQRKANGQKGKAKYDPAPRK